MKPVFLSFKGLNSFSERTEIDFNRLTQSGIFGIFGDTGSGKSTILDGINFALYGDVGRSKEKTDIINYNCESVEVTFTFNVLFEGKRKNYTIERSIKRKSGVHKATLYEESDGKSLCIADNATTVKQKIVEIIGVSADDFRKCIALPQGEFAEFVKSDPSERIKLIERLFNLSKYGEKLKTKLRTLGMQTEGEYQKLTGELSAYEDATKELAKSTEAAIKQLSEKLKLFEKQKQTTEAQYNYAKELYTKKLSLEEARANLLKLSLQAEEIAKLKLNLKLLPDCKRIIDENRFITEIESNITKENSQLKSIEADIKNTQNNIAKAQEDIDNFKYEEKLDDISNKTANLSAAKEKFESLENYHDKLKHSQTDYENFKADAEKQRKTLNKYYDNLKVLKSQLEKLPALKIESIFTDDVKKSIVRDVYVDEFNYICELRENIKEYKNDTKLFKYITEELTRRIDYLENIMRDTLANKNDFKNFIAEFQKNYEKREELNDRINKGEKLIADHENLLSNTEKDIEQKTAECKELAENFQRIFKDLSKEYGSEPNYQKISSELAALKNKLNNDNSRLKETLNKSQTKLTSLTEKKNSGLKYIERLELELASRKTGVAKTLKTIGLNDVTECKALIDEFGDYDAAQKTLDEYNVALKNNSEIVERLQKTEGIEEVNEQEVISLQNNIRECENSIRYLSGELKVNESNLKSIEEKLVKKANLLKQLETVNDKRNLVGQLEKLIHGNNFMKFIADGHLNDISKIASKMLLDLTDGRYFLIYRDGFFVGDNFNGGKERGVNTLSGGETFLVSLSLALALSEVICARSNKNIEFFFLDEGFGTLDETLIEVVMGALEKLKNSNFTIGIISHVEELKHRIESKIIVNKATESHGSALTLIC